MKLGAQLDILLTFPSMHGISDQLEDTLLVKSWPPKMLLTERPSAQAQYILNMLVRCLQLFVLRFEKIHVYIIGFRLLHIQGIRENLDELLAKCS